MNSKKKQNFILLEVDQMPNFCMSLLGNKNINTPNLDRLAMENGVIFENALTQSPICLPSRVSMLSGQYVSTTKQFGFSGLCSRNMPWLPETMQKAGYTTGAFGKFHCRSIGNDRWGFDETAPTMPEEEDLTYPADNSYKSYCEKNSISWPTDQMHCHNPFGENRPISSKADPSIPSWVQRSASESDIQLEDSIETWTTNKAINFIKKKGSDEKPFFIYLSYDRPHYPMTLPKEIYNKIDFENFKIPDIPPLESLYDTPDHILEKIFSKKAGHSRFVFSKKNFTKLIASFYTLIEYIDAEVGRLLAFLEEKKLLSYTTIIFTADHGDDAGEFGNFSKERQLSSRGVVHPPLIIKPASSIYKNIKAKRIKEPVELIDIFSTICSFADIKPPELTEGTDLKDAVINDKPLDPHRTCYCENYERRLIQKDGFKLIYHHSDKNSCEMYNCNKDAIQYFNLYHNNEYLHQKIILKKELLAFLIEKNSGSYTQKDIDRVERGLDPDDPILPIFATDRRQNTIHSFRCAAIIKNKTHEIFIPFYKDEILLYDKSNNDKTKSAYAGKMAIAYRTRDKAISPDPVIIDTLLDTALNKAILGQLPISHLQNKFTASYAFSKQEIEDIYNSAEK